MYKGLKRSRGLRLEMIDKYQQLLNLQEAVFSEIDHRDAMVAIVYLVTQPAQEPLILKVCERTNDYLREVHFLSHFQGTLPVPKIIQTVPPSQKWHGAILMEYLPGALLKLSDLTDELAFHIGRRLGEIHLNRLPGYGDPINGLLRPDPRIYFTFKFEEGLNECGDHLPTKLIRHCKTYYSRKVDLLSAVDGPCIVHRDFRPGNLIVHKGKLQGIIDWAGARASFAEEDLCQLEHGEWTKSPQHKKTFLDGYGSVRPIPGYPDLIPFLRMSKAIATLGFTIKRGTWQNRHSLIYQKNRLFLEELFSSK